MRFLHISDLHFGERQSFDRDEVQDALCEYLEKATEPLVGMICTGDVAYSGRASEYVLATSFFNKILMSTGLAGGNVVICPGNHDVDRTAVKDLKRTLVSLEESDDYFASDDACLHCEKGQSEFIRFYTTLTQREFDATDANCGVVKFSSELLDLSFFEYNTAVFCRGDDDHGKLWLGRPSVPRLSKNGERPTINVALGHHPVRHIRALASQFQQI